MTNDQQAGQLASTLAWLEDNVRENKAGIARLAQQLEQAQGQVWDLTHRLHRAEELATALGADLGASTGLQTQVSSFGDRIVHLEDRQVATDARLVDALRQHRLEIDHLRATANELVKGLDSWERSAQTWAPRVDTLEEAGRRAQEATSIVRQRVDDFERFVELVDQRGTRTADGLKRYEQDLLRSSGEIDMLQRQDAVAAERLQVYAEIFKRLEDEMAAIAQQTDVRREFNEKLDLQRSNGRRSEERINAIESTEAVISDRLEEQQRAIASLDTRDRLFRERMAALQEELGQYRSHVAEQFQKAQNSVERQKRRRIEEIEREIRELKVNAYRPPEE